LLSQRAMIPNSRGERILLVEDDDALRRMVARVLRFNGYHVVEAANGEDALASWDRHADRFDMIVTDVVMPGVGGIEVARSLRERHPGLRVIYMSGYSQEAIGRQGTLQPDATWLSKPFSSRAFLVEVRNHFDAAPSGVAMA
jgi:CheY-like chemotaxis protein